MWKILEKLGMGILYNCMEQTLLSINKVAQLLGVTTKTLRNWDSAGKLCPIRTLGGHRRYSVVDIQKIINVKNSE